MRRVVKYLLVIILCLIPISLWGYENFTAYTEVDDDSVFTVDASGLTIETVEMPSDNENYVYKDYGVDGISGDFQWQFILQVNDPTGDSSDPRYIPTFAISMGNVIDNANNLDSGTTFFNFEVISYLDSGVTKWYGYAGIQGYFGSQTDVSGLFTSFNTPYYLTIVRSGAAKIEVHCRETSHSGETIFSLGVDPSGEVPSFRYFYASQNIDTGKPNNLYSGFVSYMTSSEVGMVTITSFTADPSSLYSGGQSDLTWVTVNAAGVSITGIGDVSLSGTSSTGALGSTQVFTIQAEGAGGQNVSDQLTVTVCSPVSVNSLSASPSSIDGEDFPLGTNVDVSWSTSNASGVSIVGLGYNVALSGTSTVFVSSTTTFTVRAVDCVGNSDSDSVVVTYTPYTFPFVPATPGSRAEGVKWYSEHLKWYNEKSAFSDRQEVDRPLRGYYRDDNLQDFRIPIHWKEGDISAFYALALSGEFQEKYNLNRWAKPLVKFDRLGLENFRSDRSSDAVEAEVDSFHQFTHFKLYPPEGTVEQDFKGHAVIYNLDIRTQYAVVAYDRYGIAGMATLKVPGATFIRYLKDRPDGTASPNWTQAVSGWNSYEIEGEDRYLSAYSFHYGDGATANITDAVNQYADSTGNGGHPILGATLFYTTLPYYCSRCGVYLNDDGTKLSFFDNASPSSTGVPLKQGWITKFDDDDNILWSKEILRTTAGADESYVGALYVTKQVDGSGYITSNQAMGSANIMKIDESGATEAWGDGGSPSGDYVIYYGVGTFDGMVHKLDTTTDGDYVFVYGSQGVGAAPAVCTLEYPDSSSVYKVEGAAGGTEGDTVWAKSYADFVPYDTENAVDRDDLIVLVGWDTAQENGKALFINVSDGLSNGSQKLYPSGDMLLDISPAPINGGYIACGIKYGDDSVPRGWALKLDKYLNVEWSRYYQAVYRMELKDVIETADGGYLATGEVQYAPGYSNRRGIMIKTDIDGYSCSDGKECR